jgi:hypothetical protein
MATAVVPLSVTCVRVQRPLLSSPATVTTTSVSLALSLSTSSASPAGAGCVCTPATPAISQCRGVLAVSSDVPPTGYARSASPASSGSIGLPPVVRFRMRPGPTRPK